MNESGQKCILAKEHLIPWLRKIQHRYLIIAPVQGKQDVYFHPIDQLKDIALSYIYSVISPKHFILPQLESMFTFNQDAEGRFRIKAASEPRERIIFGLRSCDLKAIKLLDRVYSHEPVDTYYWQKRSRTLLVNLVCLEPQKSCFCLSSNSGPALEDGYDLQLTDIGHEYLVEIGSEAGRSLCLMGKLFFSKADEPALSKQYDAVLRSKTKFSNKVDLDQAFNRLLAGQVRESLWSKLAEQCLNCGGCAFICPVCSCFNVVDKITGQSSQGERIRLWDACTFTGFTRMAGGHNPRSGPGDCLKHRFYHKLLYFKENYQEFGC